MLSLVAPDVQAPLAHSNHRSKLTVCFDQVEPISSCEDNIAFPGLPIKAILQAEQREIQNSHQMQVRQMEAVKQV